MKTIALNELLNLKQNDLYSIAKIEWWLLKYEDYYNDLKSYWYCPNPRCNHRILDNCQCKNKHDEFYFLNMYKELDKFSLHHRNEHFLKNELEMYNEFKDNPQEIRNWIIKNEEIGTNSVYDFQFYYFNRFQLDAYLKVSSYKFPDYAVFIDTKDFESSIEFLKIFKKLYWEDKVFPESEFLINYEKEMNELFSGSNIGRITH